MTTWRSYQSSGILYVLWDFDYVILILIIAISFSTVVFELVFYVLTYRKKNRPITLPCINRQDDESL